MSIARMVSVAKPSLRGGVLGGVLGGLLLALAACPAPPPSCPTTTIEAWLACAPMPTSRAEFLEVPMHLQRGVFETLPSGLKHMMWQEKIAQVHDSGELGPAQREALEQLEPILVPQLWTGDPEAEAALQDWLATSEDLFDRVTAGLIARTLADFEGVPTDPSGIVVPLVSPSVAIKCECSTSDDWCAWPAPKTIHCESSDCVQWVGCGWFWSKTCDGECTGLGPGWN